MDDAERVAVTVGRMAARRSVWRLGPGLITGACNNDPSSVATYAQVGAKFGDALNWTLLFSFPLVVAIQEISARLGRVTGRGIAGNLRLHYPRWLVVALVGLLSTANVINLAADLSAMGAVLRLLLEAPALLYVGLLAIASVLFELFTRYARYVAVLKWLCLSLLSYVVCAFVVDVSWRDVARGLVWPKWSAEPQYLMAVVAALGTTISPYLFFWQAQQEVEAGSNGSGVSPLESAGEARTEFARIRFDTLLGMGLSSLVALFIVITSASTLHAHGLTIQTAAEAAEALRAVGGRFTLVLFALGILGAGLLALPALSNSAAYAVGELFSWPVGRSRGPRGAPAFYVAVVAATAIACALNFTSINPMRALYLSAVLNGVIAVPLMFAMMHMSTRSAAVGGALGLSRGLTVLGWVATAVMAASVLSLTVAVLR